MNTRLAIRRIADIALVKLVQSTPSPDSDVEAPYLRAAHVQPYGRIIDLPE
jgi:type I restriction enzyme S subunit